ncbi:MAG: fasciclin domain-containing protein [Pseudomonadota bacterium]
MISRLLLAAVLSLSVAGPAAAQASEKPTIAGIVSASGDGFDFNINDFDVLLAAVKAAGLVDALSDPQAQLTVFAPTDLAFLRLAQDLGYTGRNEAEAFDTIAGALAGLGNGDPIPVLRNVLLYHVSPGAQPFEDLRHGDPVATLLEGASIVPRSLQIFDADPEFRNPRFVAPADIEASNGFVQIINRVLIPLDIDNGFPGVGTITDIVAASGGLGDDNRDDFDLLLRAVQVAELGPALGGELGELTVFAPTDRAFVRLARALGFRGAYDEDAAFAFLVDALTTLGEGNPIPVLTNVLLYHVTSGAQPLSAVLSSEAVETLLPGATLTPNRFRLGDADPGILDPRVLEQLADIRADNGLIHVINRVLLPVRVTTD